MGRYSVGTEYLFTEPLDQLFAAKAGIAVTRSHEAHRGIAEAQKNRT